MAKKTRPAAKTRPPSDTRTALKTSPSSVAAPRPNNGGSDLAGGGTKAAVALRLRRIADHVGWSSAAVALVAALFVIWQVRLNLVFANTTPAGLDLGGHVWEVANLRDHLLPQISGWSPGMFGGVASYVLYPVLPALAMVALNVLVPYGVAMKVIVVSSVVLLPVAAWLLGRLARMPEPAPACLAVATLPFLFDSSYVAYGGNIASTVAGEYSYGLGLLALVVTLALLDGVCRTGRRRALTAASAAVCVLCHPVTGILLGVSGGILVGVHVVILDRRSWRRIVPVTIVAVALSAFWTLPFFWYRHELANTVNPRVTAWGAMLFPLPPVIEAAIMALALCGAVLAVRTRHPMAITLMLTVVVAGIGVLTLPQGVLVNDRVVPIWELGGLLLAGYGAAEVFRRLPDWRLDPTLVGPVAALAVAIFMIGINMGSFPGTKVTRTTSANGPVQHSKWLFLPAVATSYDNPLVTYSLGGYERYFQAADYHMLIETMKRVGKTDGCGRAMDEDDPTTRYGSIYQLSILPYWTDGCIAGMTGVSPDQTRNAPFIEGAQDAVSSSVGGSAARFLPLDVAAGISMLRSLGVRYYLAWSAQAQAQAADAPGLALVATSNEWDIYEVQGVDTVEPLTTQPVVSRGGNAENSWDSIAIAWFAATTQPSLPTAGGPETWPRISGRVLPAATPLPKPALVTVVQVGPDRVSFHVDHPGAPVIVRFDYFPWWHASGALGPWRAAPDNMVVVPTSTDVVLTIAPRTPDHAGDVITTVGVFLLGGLAGWDRRARRSPERHQDVAVRSL